MMMMMVAFRGYDCRDDNDDDGMNDVDDDRDDGTSWKCW